MPSRSWNRLYGPRGFFQHQSAVPIAGAFETVRKLLELTAEFGEGSFLVVLKLFGDKPSPGVLSFPLPGATLALDFPNKGESTRRLLDRMADVVLARRRAALSGQGRHHVGRGVPRRLSGLAQGRGAARSGHHVGLLAPRDRGGRMSTHPHPRRDLGDRAGLCAPARRAGLRASSSPGGARTGSPRSRPISTPCGAERRGAVRGRSRRDRDDRREPARDIAARFGAPDEVVIAYGVLGEQTAAEQDLAQARALIDTNFTSAALWILALLKRQAGRNAPLTVVGIGSVAGDRGPRQQFHLRVEPRPRFDRFLEGLTHKHDGSDDPHHPRASRASSTRR